MFSISITIYTNNNKYYPFHKSPERGILFLNKLIFKKGVIVMTKELIKEVKHIQQCLIDKEMEGEEWEEKMEIVRKLEDVSSYLKDSLGRGIEF